MGPLGLPATALVLAASLCSVVHADQHHHPSPRGTPELEYAWKKLDFAFSSEADRQNAIDSGVYKPDKLTALDLDVWEKAGRRKVFISTPFGSGPATLNIVSNEQSEDGTLAPLLQPYPDWSFYQTGSCDGVVKAMRINIDEIDRLWVVDGGSTTCPQKLLAFDLKTDKLLLSFPLVKPYVGDTSNVITAVVDVRPALFGRTTTFVYISDFQGALVVFDFQTKSAWSVADSVLKADPDASRFNVSGSLINSPDGVNGLALSPLRCRIWGLYCEDRTLYFQAMASLKQGYIKTSLLRNKRNFKGEQTRVRNGLKFFENPRAYQSSAEVMSPEGVLFFGQLPDLSIACWNSKRPYEQQNVATVARDEVGMQFNSGLKVRGGRLWMLFDRFQQYLRGFDVNEVNVRVYSAQVSDLIGGTKCAIHR